jgi:hypothetical protein
MWRTYDLPCVGALPSRRPESGEDILTAVQAMGTVLRFKSRQVLTLNWLHASEISLTCQHSFESHVQVIWITKMFIVYFFVSLCVLVFFLPIFLYVLFISSSLPSFPSVFFLQLFLFYAFLCVSFSILLLYLPSIILFPLYSFLSLYFNFLFFVCFYPFLFQDPLIRLYFYVFTQVLR